ncbi:MAG TPA: hypothetical protein VLH79_09715, partial [Chthonomonadales bacterium]|nr:hypothetical protein [Chthonomonadales bacterium]
MRRIRATLAAAVMLCGAGIGASAQAPVKLPTDPALAAYVGVSGGFRSWTLKETRNLTMAAWAAAFGPGETFDFGALMGRRFLELGLPDEDGWGGLYALDDNLTIHVHVTDRQNRLGSVRVYDVGSDALIGALQASGGGAAVQGTLSNDAEVRDYRMEIVSAAGAVLSTLAVDLGKWDAIAWESVEGGFEPYAPAPISCAQYTPRGPGSTPPGNDFFGVTGDPRKAPGAWSGTSFAPASLGCATMDVTNASANPIQVAVPQAYAHFHKREVIFNTAPSGHHHVMVGDPTSMAALQNLLTSLTVRDPTPALASVSFPPYSRGYAIWQPRFAGQATAILAAPYERVRKGGNWSILLGAIVPGLTGADFLSRLLVSAANNWLAEPQNRQASKFRQGDIRTLGDVYVLTATQHIAEARNLAPILAPVTFQVQPNISPSPPFTPTFMGSVALDRPEHWLSPAPPGPAHAGQLSFGPNGTATLQLPMGYRWRVTAGIVGPPGYTQGTVAFQTPHDAPVVIPTVLTALLQLTVWTRDPSGPRQALVTVKRGGEVVRQAMSSPREGGHAVT